MGAPLQASANSRKGLLTAHPVEPTELGAPGVHPHGLGDGRDGILYLPPEARERPHPLIVLLHGSGADARDILGVLRHRAEKDDCALLVPDARQYTWDVLLGGFGPDIAFLDRALSYTFSRCRVDGSRLAISGFSDGASYALTVGITNGALFTHIMAFSPGFMLPPRLEDSPKIFVSHGVKDN